MVNQGLFFCIKNTLLALNFLYLRDGTETRKRT